MTVPPFIELHSTDDKLPMLVNLALVTRMMEHGGEGGTVIWFADTSDDDWLHVGESYMSILRTLEAMRRT